MLRKLKFETDNAIHGLTKARGFVWYTEKGVMFEYQVSDNILEIMKSDLTDLFVPFEQISEIRWKNSWFSGGTVYITLSSLKNLDKIPFLEEAELCLKLKRKEKTKGKEFATNAALNLAYFLNDELDKL